MDEAKNVARMFSIYFENNILQNEVIELATIMITTLTFIESLIYSLCRKYVSRVWDSRKQLSAKELSLKEINVFQKLFLEDCNVSYTFFRVETSSRYFKSHFKRLWFTNNIRYIYR